MKRRLKILPAPELEALTGLSAALARARAQAATRIARARQRAGQRHRALRAACLESADREAADRIAAALIHADALRAQCARSLTEVVSGAVSAVLRGPAAPAWIHAALEDASIRLGQVTAGELRVAPAHARAAEQALRDAAARGPHLPLTVHADAALAQGTVVVVTDAGKLVVDLALLIAAMARALEPRLNATGADEAAHEILDPQPSSRGERAVLSGEEAA